MVWAPVSSRKGKRAYLPRKAPFPWRIAGKVALLLLGIPVLLFAGFILVILFEDSLFRRGGTFERTPPQSLKTIASAQADFRSNDRDGNGREEFWRKDIAGLYVLERDGEPIRLVELSVAAADDAPVTEVGKFADRNPKAGYWFRTLHFPDEKKPDPNRFAACAFPDTRRAGRWTYIISEWNTVYRKDLGSRRGLLVYPKDPLKEGWTKLD